jgi:hypothetical protein
MFSTHAILKSIFHLKLIESIVVDPYVRRVYLHINVFISMDVNSICSKYVSN